MGRMNNVKLEEELYEPMRFWLEQYVKDNSSMKQYVTSDNKISLNGIISIYETLGATCE